MFKSLSARRRTTSARRPLLAALTAAFFVFQQLVTLAPAAAAQTRRVTAAPKVINTPRLKAPVKTSPVITLDDSGLPGAPSTTVVISQVYGGAGCGTAGCSTYKNDYIELFNRGAAPQSLNGWSVQYAAATGTAWQVTNLTNVTLQPGQYYLVAQGAGANGVNNLPTPDTTGTVAMSATAAKVALVNTTTALSGQCGNGATATIPASVVDFVGYGSTANCSETANAPAPSTTTADVRAANGCTDTDNNSTNFTATTPNPRNTSSALNACGGGGGTTLSVNDVSQNEGSGGGTTTFTFTVSLSAPAGPGGVTFDIATADGTAQDDSPNTEDNDYVAQSLTGQTIPAGSSTYAFIVQVNADNVTEPNETFFVNVTNVTGATVADGQGQGTIVSDDITLVLIHDVQGNGASSPLAGATVTVRGIVTLLKSNGFFLQEEVGDNDADPNTSEGVFVFTSSAPTVAVGDQATVTGTVVEFNGLTEISPASSVSVNSTGNTLPTAVTLDATILNPTAPGDQSHLEKYEAMRLAAASLRSVSPNDGFFDIETVLPAVPRQQVFREPGIPFGNPVPPDPTSGTPDPNIPIWDRNPERINLDTNGRAGSTGVGYTSNVTFSNVAGPLDYSFNRYRLVPEAALSASANMSAVPVPTPTASEFTVSGYNIENFNNGATQRQKAADTVRTILHYPDIVGTVEIASLAALQGLRDEINNDAVAAGDPNPQYEAYLIPTPVAGITQNVGYLVKTSRVSVQQVTQEREESRYIRPSDNTEDETHDRPPLVLRATVDPAGANPRPVIVVVNHTRSFIDVELVAGDGLNARAKRKAQAEDIADLFNDLQTDNPGVPVIAVGDYNAFQFNNGYDDPLSVMLGTPRPDDQIVVDQSPDFVNPDFVNLIELVPAAERYSFFFSTDGAMQVLDHVLANNPARARNTRVHIAHVNSDFPGTPAATYANNAARPEKNSDHDPTIAYFTLGSPQATGSLIISEFRFRGPNTSGPMVPSSAPDNEFVELYNNTDADITVQTTDGSAGYAIVASDGTVLLTVPNGTVIPARGHWLGFNANGYSLYDYGGTGAGEGEDGWIGSTIPDNGGVALFRTANPVFFAEAERLDAAGYTTAPALYREGAGLPTGGPEFDEDVAEWSFFRNFTAPGGRPIDTGDNAADFLGASTDGAGTGLGQRLGAPGPENLSSPVERNGFMPLLLLDATKPAASPPNRLRDFTSDPMNNSTFGTLTIRRRVVNSTGQNVVALRFRLINITTFPAATSDTADLRALTSTDVTVSNITDPATCAAASQTAPCSVTVQGTVLEEPPAQPNGGGWNSSLRVPISLAAGASANVQFVLGIQQPGSFRFYLNVESVTEPPVTSPRPATLNRSAAPAKSARR